MSPTPAECERMVRAELEMEFGKPFGERELAVGRRLDGATALKNFDAVSNDKKVVASVKNLTVANQNGNRTARLPRVMHEMLLLHFVVADRKFMYLSQVFIDWLKSHRDAVIPDGVEVRPIPTQEDRSS